MECPAGFYLIAVPEGVRSCNLCDPNARCDGGNVIIPLDGYSRVNMSSAIIMECINPDACLEGDSEE